MPLQATRCNSATAVFTLRIARRFFSSGNRAMTCVCRLTEERQRDESQHVKKFAIIRPAETFFCRPFLLGETELKLLKEAKDSGRRTAYKSTRSKEPTPSSNQPGREARRGWLAHRVSQDSLQESEPFP